MTTQRPSRAAAASGPVSRGGASCSHCDGKLQPLGGENPHKLDRRVCDSCGCAYTPSGAGIARGANCPAASDIPAVEPMSAADRTPEPVLEPAAEPASTDQGPPAVE